ncbi:MAG: KpsF/GutQ family sugar-phosphate isomerase [Phycisphaerales bacterium]|nr:MAG: KpsF/GutQ family sugar-phosphate isomerase [Phycisphaerales bacterium]
MSDTLHQVRPDSSASGQDRASRILARGKAILRTESEAILDAESRLGDAFVAAVELIVSARGRVGVTGMGKAGLVGNKVQSTLASTGTLAYRFHPIEALHGDIGMIHGDDVILAFSKSGGSELVELMPLVQRMGCKVILVTANPSSRAAAHADIVLDIGRTEEACPLGLAPSSSAVAMMAIGDALALTVMECTDFSRDQYARNHPGGALGRYLMKAHEVMRTGPDCPQATLGATLGDCWEAIKAAPRRAGAACVVDGEGRLVGIVTQGDFFRMFKAPGDRVSVPVGDVMTKGPKSIGQGERAVEALRIMQHYAIDELPVVDDQRRLLGMIDIQDLVARGFTT